MEDIVQIEFMKMEMFMKNKKEMMDMRLYEITEAMLDTLDIFLESDGTNLDQENYGDIMLFLRDEFENKNSKIIEYIKNLEAESKAAKEEANRLQDLSKSRLNKIKRLKD